MSRKGESITLSLSADEKEQLEAIALSHNCTWGSKPNVSKLLSKIADGSLLVVGEKPVKDSKTAKGKKAIQLIIKGLLELSITLFGN
jgi:hypothetical protein